MKKYSSRIKDKALLFILNPFLSGVTSLKDIRDGVSHKFLYLWFLIFGVGFCAVYEGADSFYYVENFMIEHSYTWSQYYAQINEYLTFESNIKDIYTLTVNFLVGRFSDNYHWTYFIYAAVFGFFYIKSLRIFLKHNTINNELLFYLLLFIFCFSNPIFNINGVRFWTAAWVGVYAGLKAVVDKKLHYLILLIITPFIHGTFPIWIALILLALFLGRFNKIWKVLFVASSFVSAVSFLSVLDNIVDFLPQFMQNQIWSYTQSESALKKISGEIIESMPLYAQIFTALPKYFTLFISYLVVFNSKLFTADSTSSRLFNVFVVLSTITNFLSSIPSMGRFQYMVIPFLVILWSMNYQKHKHLDRYFKLIPIVYCYALLYWFRHMNSITELYLYVFPAPLTVINYLFL